MGSSCDVPNELFMKDLLLRAVSRVLLLYVVDVVGTGHTRDDMMSGVVLDGQAVVVDRKLLAAKSIVCDFLLRHSALQLLSFVFRRNQEARGATFLVALGQRHVTNPTSRCAQILHAKDGLMLAERSFPCQSQLLLAKILVQTVFS